MYPHISKYFQKTSPTALTLFISQYSTLEPSERDPSSVHTLMGRVVSKREASKSLTFFDIESDSSKVQIMATKRSFSQPEEFRDLILSINRGDILSVIGFPAKTKLAELSLVPHSIEVLSPCIHDIPENLKDPGLRFKARHLDFLVNKSALETMKKRFKIISSIREFLSGAGYLEVETPILSPKAGGAIATPFVTRSRYVNEPLFLRIAPELFLKKLIIGGMDGIFEIGKQFRNEGFDSTHNVEFTTVELYKPYIHLEHLYTLTEELFISLFNEYRPDLIKTVTPKPWPRISIPQALSELTLYSFSQEDLSGTPSTDAIKAAQAALDDDDTEDWPTLMTKLVDLVEERMAVKYPGIAIFLINHPIVISPLAKNHETLEGCSDRFEVFIDGKEYVNAYNELNDPREQEKRFIVQGEVKKQIPISSLSIDTEPTDLKQIPESNLNEDSECLPADSEFVKALEYGLPPTCGWGLGIDRLVMLLTGQQHIREVLAFPTH